jgi:hypothetical protein
MGWRQESLHEECLEPSPLKGISSSSGAMDSEHVRSRISAGGAPLEAPDDADLLRAGSTAAVLGHQVLAPSTLGTFLRGSPSGHLRQPDRLAEPVFTRAWAAGVGLGNESDSPVQSRAT